VNGSLITVRVTDEDTHTTHNTQHKDDTGAEEAKIKMEKRRNERKSEKMREVREK
jgi:hypothetical protein